jgi:hypothetical protein
VPFTLVGTANSTGNTGTAFTVDFSATGRQAGDLLVLHGTTSGSGDPMTIPAGWTLLGANSYSIGGTDHEHYCLVRVSDGTEGAITFNVPAGTGSGSAGVGAVWRGGTVVNGFVQGQTAAAATSWTTPSLTPTRAGCLILYLVNADANNAGDFTTADAALTERYDYEGVSATWLALAGYSEVQATAAAVSRVLTYNVAFFLGGTVLAIEPGGPTLPSAPGQPVATFAGPGSARLLWNAPTVPGSSATTGYRITPYVGGVAQAPISTGSTATAYTVAGLTNGTAYTFTVAAITIDGVGADSVPSSAFAPQAASGSAIGSAGTIGSGTVASDAAVVPVANLGTASSAATAASAAAAAAAGRLTGSSAAASSSVAAATAAPRLTGASAATAGSTATLAAAAVPALTGTSAAAAGSTATLAASTVALSGTSAAVAGSSAAAKAAVAATGASSATGSSTAALLVARQLAGTSAGASSSTAVAMTVPRLSGTSTAAGTSTATATAAPLLAATSASTSTGTAAATSAPRLAASSAAGSTSSAAAAASARLSGTSTAGATSAASLAATGSAVLAGASAASSSSSAAATASPSLAATSAATAASTGLLAAAPQLGAAVTVTNLVSNPSAEVNLTGISATGGTPTRAANPGGGDGSWVVRVTYVAGSNAVAACGPFWGTASPDLQVTPGRAYFASVQPVTLPAGRQARISIEWKDAAGALLGGTVTGVLSTSLERRYVSGVAPATAVRATVTFYALGCAGGEYVEADACVFAEGPVVAGYFAPTVTLPGPTSAVVAAGGAALTVPVPMRIASAVRATSTAAATAAAPLVTSSAAASGSVGRMTVSPGLSGVSATVSASLGTARVDVVLSGESAAAAADSADLTFVVTPVDLQAASSATSAGLATLVVPRGVRQGRPTAGAVTHGDAGYVAPRGREGRVVSPHAGTLSE